MDEHQDDPWFLRGRLHGHWLRALAVVAAVTVVAAVWQFSSMMSHDEDEPPSAWPWQDPTTARFSDNGPSTEGTAADSAEASPPSTEPSTEASIAEPEPPLEMSAATETSEDTPTAAAPTEAATTESAPEESGCAATIELEDSWNDWVQMSVVVVNSGNEPILGWEVTIAIDGAEVHHYWGMRHDEDDRYRSEDWNGSLDPDESAQAAFQASTENSVEFPDTLPCKALD